jgi:uncharacterized protein YgbK (DUF1537 family)
MHDADLVRVLQRQAKRAVGLTDWSVISKGEAAIRADFVAQRAAGKRILIVDTLTDTDLRAIGAACDEMRLITGGSGIAMGLPDNFRNRGKLPHRSAPTEMPGSPGRAVILAGSCSVATRGQIERAKDAGAPIFRVDVDAVAHGRQNPAQIADWVLAQPSELPPLVYSSSTPDDLARIQATLGRHESGALVEHVLGEVAKRLLESGFARFLIAGGETSGAVINRIGIKALSIGPEIDPGVPWTRSVQGPDVTLALKSGNFGAPDFFLKAWAILKEEPASA